MSGSVEAAVLSSSERPWLYYITDRSQIPEGGLLGVVRRVLRGGIDFVQVREKDLPDGRLVQLTARIVEIARPRGCRVLVNGRADVALAAAADGVHLPSAGLRPGDVRPWVPPGFLIGVSVHGVDEARVAEASGADYVLAGPVYATPSKLKYGKPMGIPGLARVCRAVRIPVFGLGGIRAGSIPEVTGAGAAGIAAIRLFQREPRLLRCASLRPARR